MKKLFVTVLTILTCGAVHALPVGNPSDASLLCDGLIWEGHCGDPCDPCLTWCDAFSIRSGFYGDYVFNRHLEIDTNGDDSVIEHTSLFTNGAIIAANFWDRFDFFTTLGSTNFLLATNASAFSTTFIGRRIEIETNSHFSWSLGIRGTIWECGCTSLGAEAQYFYTHPDVRRVTVGADLSEYPNNIDLKYREWQVGVGLSHRINVFVPYVAVKWSRAKVNFDDAILLAVDDIETVSLRDLESKGDWGFAIGVSLIDCEKASLTVEGRFGGEKAVHVNGQIRF